MEVYCIRQLRVGDFARGILSQLVGSDFGRIEIKPHRFMLAT
jgi:hypothetical protein